MANFLPVTSERYWEMLEVLPPRLMDGKGFLVGEPDSHRRCRSTNDVRATYGAFVEVDEQYYECDEPLTAPEYAAVLIKNGVPTLSL